MVLTGYDSDILGGNIQLVGYLNGSPVSGTTLTQTVGDVLLPGSLVSFDVSGNSAFQGIDSFRVLAAAGHDITGMLGVGPIDAVNFYFPGPIITVDSGSAAFVSGNNVASNPVAIDSGLTLADTASSTLGSATVAITGNFHSGEDILAFMNNGSTQGNIAATYDASTGTLTLTSSGATATVVQWQSALESVTYTDRAVTPNNATRTVSFDITDASSNTSSPVTRAVTVADTDQTPIVAATGGSTAFTAGNNTVSTPVAVDSSITVSDLDNTTLASATVSITGNFHVAEDVLAFTNTSAILYGNVTASYNSGTGVLSLSSAGATATVAQWQAALRAVTYTDSAVTPNTANRAISFAVNDGSLDSTPSTRTVTVADTDQSPIVTASGGSAAFTAADNTASTPVPVDSGITVSDLDNATLASATVSLTGNFNAGEDILAFISNPATEGNITGSYASATGVLTLTSSGATATLAQWQAALRSITYTDTAVTPNNATRTVSFVVNDGSADSTASTRLVTVTDTDQSPIVTTSAGTIYAVSQGAPVTVDASVTVSDLDNTTQSSGMVIIGAGFQFGDTLAFSNTSGGTFGNIVASYISSLGLLTLTSSGATATDAQWAAALGAVTFASTSAIQGNRTLDFVVSDGSSSSSTAATDTVTVLTGPTVVTDIGSAAFTAGDNGASTPVIIDSGLTVADPSSSTLVSATISITSNFQGGEDVLAFTNDGSTMGNVAGSYDGSTGVLTLTSAGGTATLAQWQAALRSATYTDTAIIPDPATRTISLAVADGTNTSTAATRTVTVADTVQTPSVSTSGSHIAYATNAVAVPVDAGLTIGDRNNRISLGATIAVTNGFQIGDTLAFTNTSAATYGDISAAYQPSTGQLLLSSQGQATLAQFQAALRAVIFSSSSATSGDRTVSFQLTESANGQSKQSSPAIDTITWFGVAVGSGSVTLGNSATLTTALVLPDIPLVVGGPGGNASILSISNGGSLQTGMLTVEAGSSLTVDQSSQVSATSLTLQGGSADLYTLSSSTPVTFGPQGSLVVHALSGASTVSGLTFGDTLHLAGIATSTGLSQSVTAGGGTLAIGTATGVNAYLSDDGNGGTIVTPTSQTVNVYRFFESQSGTQFVTTSAQEAQNLLQTSSAYVYEGTGIKSLTPANGDPNSLPVFRFFDVRDGSHFYTASTTERDAVARTRPDLVLEGTAFYEHTTPQPGDTAIYRFFDTGSGSHFYTDSAAERAAIIATRPDLTNEGIAFYEAPSA